MKSPLKVIEELGCPTNSYIAAIQYLAQQDVNKAEYEKQIQEIIGLSEPPDCKSWYYARTLFMYVVQETIREFNTGHIPIMEDILHIAHERSVATIEANPWNETYFNIKHGLKVDIDVDTGEEGPAIAIKKGAKKDVAEKLFLQMKLDGGSRQDIIASFMNKVGMSKPGATTYFHALKKEFGFNEKNNPEKQIVYSESKQELAERLYIESADKTKSTIISLFTEKLQTSKLGAQTYFYACKKKFQPLTQNQQ